ncbi:hypothetical protein Tco_1478174, partial [Tanacetum coccineum]
MSTLKFAETHQLVAFLEKPEESNGFEGIIDLLNASSIKYALTDNPTVYESCIKQFWATAKAKTVNEEPDTHGDFSGKITPLFQTMMVQAPKDMGEDSVAPTDSHSIPIITQPLLSKPQKKKYKRKQRKDIGPTEPIPDEATNEEPISTPFCNLPQSGLKKLRKVGSDSRIESFNDVSLGAQEDTSKQGRKIADLDADEEVTLIDETQGRNDEDLMFDTDVLNGDEVFKEPIVNVAETTSSIPFSVVDPVTTDGEVVTTASATTTVDELTLAQTLIEIKAAKPKAVTTVATKITTVVASTRPKAKGIIFHDQEEQAPTFTPIVSS